MLLVGGAKVADANGVFRMVNVNVMCSAEGTTRPCAACLAAGKALEARGLRVHYSERYEALRAALAGGYGFGACVVPIDSREPAVADAAITLLEGKKVAVVTDDAAALDVAWPAGFSVLTTAAFERCELSPEWLMGLGAAN